ncbi:MAG: hypothetical protein DWQ31_05635 [Planctomycetota bacterium]|nr:MAG: hypothetical protein DWQ31_05635 [Planctomycetota bacterium]REJ92994.1 MAG: hypothetical protein DWQ35_11185 [Planctomycetota bacterium]
MRVLIADELSATSIEGLEALGLTLDVRPETTAETLPEVVGDAHILIVRSTQVTADVFAAASELSLVIRAGAGVNTIDLPAASARGVYVANCPGRNTAAVAELAVGLLIAADRRLVDASVALREGRWLKKQFSEAAGLNGRTLGILGYGAIGRAVARRAAALGMRIAAWSRSLTAARAAEDDVIYAETPLALAAMSDAVSVHLAETAETKHLVNAEFLAALGPNALLVNTSRGGLVDTQALREAIDNQGLRVGLDVFENEPAGGEANFADTGLAATLTGTPHIGAATSEASEAIATEVVRIVESFVSTGRPLNTVNLCARSPATHHLVIRHYNQVGVLAGVLDRLRADGLNVQEMENTIFEGAEAACCTLSLDGPASASTLEQLRENEDILHVLLESN